MAQGSPKGPVQPSACWASVSLTVRLVHSLHGDVMGRGICWVSGGLQRPAGAVFGCLGLFYQLCLFSPCPSLPGGQLLCSYDQFHRDPSAGSRLLCRGEDSAPLLGPVGDNVMESPWALVVMQDKLSDEVMMQCWTEPHKTTLSRC